MSETNTQNAKWDAQLRKGTLELAVLAAIGAREKYGLELLNFFHSFQTMQITEGTLYPLLDRLKREGIVAAEWRQEGDIRPRKYYSLTPQGEERLLLLKERWERSVADLADLLGRVND